MKKGKAVGPDNVPIEFITALEETGVEEVTKLLNIIYETGKLLEDLTKSVFIALPKKPGTTECEKHRTISLMSHLTKILLRVLGQKRNPTQRLWKRWGYQRSLIKTIRKRQMKFLGHIYRKDGIEKQVLWSKIEGKRGKGRQRNTFINSLNNYATDGTITNAELIRKTEDREVWRAMDVDVCSKPDTLGGGLM